MAVDPKSEKYVSFSTYSYALNDPILFVDPDGRDIDISQMKDKESIEALKRILSTKEGFKFFSQYANKGNLNVGGKVFSFAKNGVYSKNTISFRDMGATKDADGVRTFGITTPLDKDKGLKIGNDFTYDIRNGVNFNVAIDNTLSTEKAAETILHETTLHVESETNRLNSISNQLNKKSLNLETYDYAKALNNIYYPNKDHQILTSGQASKYLNITNQLDKLQKTNGTHMKIYNEDMKAQKTVINNARRIYGQQ